MLQPLGNPHNNTFATTASTVDVTVPKCQHYTLKRRGTGAAFRYATGNYSKYLTVPADQAFNSPTGLVEAHTVRVTLPSGDDTMELIYWR